jgi:hypothetical protein
MMIALAHVRKPKLAGPAGVKTRLERTDPKGFLGILVVQSNLYFFEE